MSDVRIQRISRELFLGAVGGGFGVLEPWVTDRLSAIPEEEELPAGAHVYEVGDPPDDFYFVLHGRLELRWKSRPSRFVEGPGAFGMLDAILEHPRSHAAVTVVPMQLLRVRMDAWLELLEDSFPLARMAVQRLVHSVAGLEEGLWKNGSPLPSPVPVAFGALGSPLDVVERLAVLMQAPPLRDAGAQPISDLASLCEEVSFANGESLFESGAASGRVFVLVQGRVSASKESPHVSWRGVPGQVVIGTAALGDTASAWKATAMTPVRALAFRVDDWLDVLEENFDMVRATLRSLATANERLGGDL